MKTMVHSSATILVLSVLTGSSACQCEGGHHGLPDDPDADIEAFDSDSGLPPDADAVLEADAEIDGAEDGSRWGDSPHWDVPDVDDPDARLLECSSCHGDEESPAPPAGLDDDETADHGVGAHRSHLRVSSTWHRDVVCEDCHLVPTTLLDPGHIDSAEPAELTWSAAAAAGGASPAFDGTRCSGTYCHGGTLGASAGPLTAPSWTTVDGSQAACGTCHGLPPGGAHPGSTRCETCHGAVVGPGFAFVAPERHIDGNVDVISTACDSCHGESGESAPPLDLVGERSTTARGVGAHRSHLQESGWHRRITCSECHVVPATLDAAGHLDSDLPAELTWGAVSTADGATPAFDGLRCTGTYCHGATFGASAGPLTEPTWTRVDGSQAACGSTCHGLPPGGSHPPGARCDTCHAAVMSGPAAFRDGSLHIDGVVEVDLPPGTPCDFCHGAPPATGSHAAHFAAGAARATYGGLETAADAGSPDRYGFGCGNCHGRNPADHMNGTVEVELYDPTAPAGSILALQPPAALYTSGPTVLRDADGLPYTLGSCSTLYCHSSGQAAASVRTYAADAIWGGTLPGGRCNECHGDPPAYPSAGAGMPGANSHYDPNGFGLGWGPVGHVFGIHWVHDGTTSAAGSASPLNCNVCHYATTSYEADTTFADPASPGVTCGGSTCHTASTVPPAGNPGRITDTAFHVDGDVDVVFSAAPFRTPSALSYAPAGWTRTTAWDETLLPEFARWDVATGTCSNVPCHIDQTVVRWGALAPEIAGCDCHAF